MTVTTPLSINYIIQQITIYYGIPVFFIGVIGAILNVLVFLTASMFREKSCVFYLIIMSTFDFGRLFTSTLSNILSWGFEINLTMSSLFFCKIKAFILTICSLSSMTCLCLAVIDQYFATSSHPRLQQLCHIKLAHRLTGIFLIIWTIHGIPYFVFYNHIISPSTSTTICQITNEKFIKYHTYGYFLTLSNLLPLIIIVFGLMAYRNSRRLTHRKGPLFQHELDKQLTTMVLVQILIYFFTFLPYSIQSMYALITTNNDPVFRTTMELTSIFTLYFSVLSYASPFYIYVCVSKYFRQQLKYALYDMNFEGLQSVQLDVDEEAAEQQLHNYDEY